MAGAASYPEGTTALVFDPEQRSLVKIVSLLTSGGGGGGGGSNTSGAAFDPNGSVTGSPGDIYKSAISLGGDGSEWFKVSGTATNTGWE